MAYRSFQFWDPSRRTPGLRSGDRPGRSLHSIYMVMKYDGFIYGDANGQVVPRPSSAWGEVGGRSIHMLSLTGWCRQEER